MQVRKFPRKILKYLGQHDFRQQICLQHTRSPQTEIITWHMKSHFENYCLSNNKQGLKDFHVETY